MVTQQEQDMKEGFASLGLREAVNVLGFDNVIKELISIAAERVVDYKKFPDHRGRQ